MKDNYSRIEAYFIILTKEMAQTKKQESKEIRDLTLELLFDVIKYVHSTAKYLCRINLSKELELIIKNKKERNDQDYSREFIEFSEQVEKSLSLLQTTELEELTAPLILQDYFLSICRVVVKFAMNSGCSALMTRIRNEILIEENNVKQSDSHSTQSPEVKKMAQIQP